MVETTRPVPVRSTPIERSDRAALALITIPAALFLTKFIAAWSKKRFIA